MTTAAATTTTPPQPGASRQRRLARAVVPARIRPQIFGAVRSALHRGHDVYCPCCEGEFDSFIAHRGVSPGKCPRCGSLERHRLLMGFLYEQTDLVSARLSVLHLAPEYPLQRRLRRLTNLAYRSADLDSPLAMDKVDLLDMPYADRSFDVLICNHVLEHVADDRQALRGIRRVLKRDGVAILMSPIDDDLAKTLEDSSVTAPVDRLRVFGQEDHVRRYGRDFADRVERERFAVQVVSYVERFSADEISQQGLRRDATLFPNDDIFLCRPTASSGEPIRTAATT